MRFCSPSSFPCYLYPCESATRATRAGSQKVLDILLHAIALPDEACAWAPRRRSLRVSVHQTWPRACNDTQCSADSTGMADPPFNPWLRADANLTYAKPSGTCLWSISKRHRALNATWLVMPPNATSIDGAKNLTPMASWANVFTSLRREGVSPSAIGLELAPRSQLPTKSPALRSALGALVYRNDIHSFGRAGNAEWAKLLFDADAQTLKRVEEQRANASRVAATQRFSGYSAGVANPLEMLLRDGLLQVNDFGLNVTALREQAYHTITREGRLTVDGELITSRGRLPALEPLLHNESFARLLRGYLGGPVRFDGHATFQLTPEANVESYPSGWWHHDRCGRRLRLFIYVHDVTPTGRPTLAARGSHRTVAYYSCAPPTRKMPRLPQHTLNAHALHSDRAMLADCTRRRGTAWLRDARPACASSDGAGCVPVQTSRTSSSLDSRRLTCAPSTRLSR